MADGAALIRPTWVFDLSGLRRLIIGAIIFTKGAGRKAASQEGKAEQPVGWISEAPSVIPGWRETGLVGPPKVPFSFI